MSPESKFRELWQENQVARHDPEEDFLHIYTKGLEGVDEVSSEETENHILLQVDSDTGELLGFTLPRFSAVAGLVGGGNCTSSEN